MAPELRALLSRARQFWGRSVLGIIPPKLAQWHGAMNLLANPRTLL